MSNDSTSKRMSRRNFLKVAGLVGATAVGGHLVDTYAPWLNYKNEVGHAWRTYDSDSTLSTQKMEMVRYATLAANGHNTQPWKFSIKEDSIEIHPDFSRELSVVDPQHRELWISLGCALENLLVSARAAGYAPEVIYPEASEYIKVKLDPDKPQESPLFNAITLRQNTRSEYDGQTLSTDLLDQLQAIALEPDVSLKFVTNPTNIETAVEYVSEGNLSQYSDQQFVDELISWLRFNKKEALSSMDGLYSVCSGNPSVPGWLGRMFVSGTKPQQQADLDAKKMRSSAGAVVIASETENKTAWVRSGQVYERMALLMTSLNIKSAFLNQPIEVTDLRGEFQTAMGLGNALPQLLVRFGYAESMPKSLRRPVEEVLF